MVAEDTLCWYDRFSLVDDMVIDLFCGTGVNFDLVLEQIGKDGRLGIDGLRGKRDLGDQCHRPFRLSPPRLGAGTGIENNFRETWYTLGFKHIEDLLVVATGVKGC